MIHFLPFSLGGFGLIGRAGCQLRKGGEHFGEPLGKEQRMDSSGIGPPWQGPIIQELQDSPYSNLSLTTTAT